jgi:geranylgeranyl diphosphate synthase type I
MDETVRDRVENAVFERRRLVNDAVPDYLPIQPPERLYEASRYLLDAGGKRLRPTVLLLAAEALTGTEPFGQDYQRFGPDEVDVMAAAMSVEIIQSFTLIHDDIMDNDDLRRGVPAVHREYDLSTAILAGDTLYSKAFECMLQTGAPPDRSVAALERLAKTCTRICEGQSLDVAFENREDVTVEEYLEMVEFKTAVLYAASASIPAILLDTDEEVVEALRGYGLDVGRAFQIQDDLLDLTRSSEQLGKQRGSDLVEHKRTLITLHARQQGVDVDGLVDADTPEGLTDEAVEDAVERLEAAGSIQFARETALDLVENGREHLRTLPPGEARDRLSDIAAYLVERDY